jgi:hypothetical protein
MRMLVFGLMLLLAAAAPDRAAHAWGREGHWLIADLTWERLSPGARTQIARLLASDGDGAVGGCALATFRDASVWPDCARGTEAYAFSAPFHYDSIPLCGAAAKASYCLDGACATEAIKRYRAILADPARSDAERLEALAFLAHMVQDIHQPLHANANGDRGANLVFVSFLGEQGFTTPAGEFRPFNLHGVWDSRLLPYATGPEGLGLAWIRAWAQQYAASWRNADPDIWAAESNAFAFSHAQLPLPEPFVCGAPPALPAALDEAYIAQAAPVVRLRLVQAAVRLADTLEAALAR